MLTDPYPSFPDHDFYLLITNIMSIMNIMGIIDIIKIICSGISPGPTER